MAIVNLPVWPFPHNWSEDLLETLEWLTDILRSPTGAEQRRKMRMYPRRSLEFSIAVKGTERSYFDNLMMTHGGRVWYLPVWHEAHIVSAPAVSGSSSIECASAIDGEIRIGDTVFISNGSIFEHELFEVAGITSTGITTIDPLTKSWPKDAMIHPVRRARMTDQPSLQRLTDELASMSVRFSIVEPNNEVSPIVMPQYRGFDLLDTEPEERETLEYGYERIFEDYDNSVSAPIRIDSANMSFPRQRFAWTIYGRQQHKDLRRFAYGLAGKLLPIWIPTFFSDFELAGNTGVGESFLTVRHCGFTELGGPRESRRDVCIFMNNGDRLHRRIVASAAVGELETIGLDAPFPDGLKMGDVYRISFMALCRQDQDQLEINHKTDSAGTSTVVTTFRTTPDLRVELPGI